MKVMVLMKATKESEAGVLPSTELLAEMGAYNEELLKAGVLKDGDGLLPSSKGKRVRFRARKAQVVDGPFAETKELVGGFWMWEVASMEDAVEWAKRCPAPAEGEMELELRRVFAPDDFGEAFTPELREQEERMRGQLAPDGAESA